MDIQEWWWLADVKVPKKMYGSLTEKDVDRLIEGLKNAEQ